MMNFKGNSETPLDPSVIDPALRYNPLQPGQDGFTDLPHGPQAMASPGNLSSLGDLSGLDNEPTWVNNVLTDPRVETAVQTSTELISQGSALLSQTVESSKLLGQATVASVSESMRRWLDAAAESWNDPDNAIHNELNYQATTFMEGLKELATDTQDSGWVANAKQRLGELSNRFNTLATKMGDALGYIDYESATPEEIAVEAAAVRLKENLVNLRENPAFLETFQTAFGDDVSAAEATAVLNNLIAGHEKPEIKVVAADKLQGQGAFGDNTIFISEQLLAAGRSEALDRVLMEEIGHYFDQTLNPIDSPGDEGEIFARLAQGETLTNSGLAQLKREDDHATRIGANGAVINVEQSNRLTYEVQAGDTLWAIAQQYLGDGRRWTELQKENGSAFTEAEATQLQVGQQLYIPNAGATAPQETRTYTLVSGDTLWEIAQRELGDGSRWTELQKEDGTGFTEAEAVGLQPGQVIHIPGASDPTSPEPTNPNPTSPAPESPSGDIELGTYTPNVTQAFLDKVTEISGRLGAVPEYLMAVMGFETGGTYSPGIRNSIGATGLIQFLKSTAVGLGTTTDQLASMSAVEQLDYVEQYLQPYSGRLNSLEDTYMAVLWPKGIGQAPDQAIMTGGDGYYDGNSGLDLNNDGAITPREAADKVRQYLPGADLFGGIANEPDGGAAPDTSGSGSLSPVWDGVSQERIQSLHPTIQDEAIRFINRVEAELGIQLRVTDAFRSFAQQDQLYQQGRNGNAGAIVTNAEGGESYHNYGLAIDVVAIVNGAANYDGDYWQQVAEIGKSEGFEWGGDFQSFKDQPHFQFSYGQSVGELEAQYEQQRAAGDITDPNEIQGLGGNQPVAVPDSPTSSPAAGGYPGYMFDYASGQSLRYDANVERWQQRMQDLGWDIAVDGEYGPQSRGIALAFQQQYPILEDDGIVGPATWEATFSADAKGPNAPSAADPNSTPENDTSITSKIDELRQRQADLNQEIQVLGTTSPSVTNALQNELNTVEDQLAEELRQRIPELENSINSLGTTGGYATLAMQEELSTIKAELDALESDASLADPNPVIDTGLGGSPTVSGYPGYAFDYEPGQLLRYDANVERWQQRMQDLGWDIAVDGEYGPQSRGVALAFQQRYSNLEDDGIVGPATWEATFSADAKGPNAPSTDNTSSTQRISELRQQQADLNRDIEALGTTSSSVTNALQNELNTVEDELAEELKNRIPELENSIDSLGTAGGDATLAMQEELRDIQTELDLLEADAPSSTGSNTAIAGGYPGYAFDYKLGQSLSYDANVARWQQRMRDLGWDIIVNGEYGPQSREIALAFQQRYPNLEDDGIVGSATWEATFSADAQGPNEAGNSGSSPQPSSSPPSLPQLTLPNPTTREFEFELNFETGNQSIWGTGGGVGIDESRFLGVDWNHEGSVGSLSGYTNGKAGLEAKFALDSGTVDASLPIDVKFSIPENIRPGQTITIASDFSIDKAAFFETSSPEIEAALDLILEVEAGAKADIAGYEFDLLDVKTGGRTSLLEIGQKEENKKEEDNKEEENKKQTKTQDFLDAGSIELKLPEVNTRGEFTDNKSTDNSASSSGKDSFLTAELDLDKVASIFIPALQSLGKEFEFDKFGQTVKGAYDLLDVKLAAQLLLAQDFSLFLKEVPGQLTLENGETIDFKLGEDIKYTVPENYDFGKTLEVDASFTPKTEFENKTGLSYDVFLELAALSASGKVNIKWAPDINFDIGPLYEDQFTLFDGDLFNLYDKKFALSGWKTETKSFEISLAQFSYPAIA
jgi:peptidoglycan hydrolase-like protein with peptidoglycan-binding domain/nucleoid-associated protein YgaU